jgi:hypothetical protein
MSTSSSDPGGAPGGPGTPGAPRRPRTRRVSRTRQTFLAAINAQITSTRVLAIVVLAICLAGGVYWLVGTTGSPVIGISFIALALVLSVTVYSFIRVMYMFTGRR